MPYRTLQKPSDTRLFRSKPLTKRGKKLKVKVPTQRSSVASGAGPIKAPAVRAVDEAIVIRGAKVHNLKNIDTVIPRDQLTVITGPSGSGKSSLAFDTIYAEGQRRYVESLS